MAPPDMVTAFVRGDLDAYFAWEPHVYYAAKQVAGESKVFPAGELYHGRHCIAMNKDYVLAHPDVVEKFVRGLLRAEEFVTKHPEEAMKIVAKTTGMDEEALKSLWPEYTVKVELDGELMHILEKEAAWARSISSSEETLPDFRKYIYTDALQKSRPSSVQLSQ
jgi:ABC-type nitrate/sulfonate/bicarbonate transport system substrate-binding protein